MPTWSPPRCTSPPSRPAGLRGIDPGTDVFLYHPEKPASFADMARYLFHGLKLPVKMDYTDLWKIVPWINPKFASPKNRQHCTPQHWATYYLMTLYNMGAFTSAQLASLDPDAPARRSDLVQWAEVAARRSVPVESAAAGFTRAELADFIVRLTP